MAQYEIVSLPKTLSKLEARKALAAERPGLAIENLELQEDEWVARLYKPDRVSARKRKGADDEEKPTKAPPKDEAEAEAPSDESSDSEKPSEDSKVKPEGAELVNKIQDLLKQLTGLTAELEGTATSLADKHDEKHDALQEVKDLAEKVAPPKEAPTDPSLTADGGPVGPSAVSPPGAPRVPKGLDKRKRPGPGGGGVTTFTHNQNGNKTAHRILTHKGKDEAGNALDFETVYETLKAQVESEYPEYEISGLQPNKAGGYSAKLKLRDDGSSEE